MSTVKINTDAEFDWMNLPNREGALLLLAAVVRELVNKRGLDKDALIVAVEDLGSEAKPERSSSAMELIDRFTR